MAQITEKCNENRYCCIIKQIVLMVFFNQECQQDDWFAMITKCSKGAVEFKQQNLNSRYFFIRNMTNNKRKRRYLQKN